MTILVYGLPKGETKRYAEVLLAETCKTQEQIDRVKQFASLDGFHSFRIATWDGDAPDFTNIFN